MPTLVNRVVSTKRRQTGDFSYTRKTREIFRVGAKPDMPDETTNLICAMAI